MKKTLALLLAAITLLLCACSPKTAAPLNPTAGDGDIAALEKLYEGRVAYHGDTHVHTNSGGNSDGKLPIDMWPATMDRAGVDFVAIMDHRQTIHMRMEEWDDSIFIGGAECGIYFSSVNEEKGKQKMHALYLFSDVEDFENVLNAFPEIYAYTDGLVAQYGNGNVLSHEQLAQIIETVKRNNGLFVYPHPLLVGNGPTSGELMDFWFADETGLEIFYGMYGPAEYRDQTLEQYELWKQLLAEGKRIWATAGSDSHTQAMTTALSTIYSEEKSGAAFLERMRVGDFTPAPIGIRMAIGDTLMGGQGSFEGEKVIFSVGDFHESVLEKYKNFRVVLLDDSGEVFRQDFTAEQTAYFAVEAKKDAKFYRVEIYDADKDLLIGIGNPIWNQ
ncbi:MAG: hypothetical protein IJO56_02600 [Oscillospiraceae bacterium]|nr:hypothetical protein [Oscillospiraceae bacterium]